MSVIILFIDGIGIGKKSVKSNPCFNSRYKYFTHLQNLPRQGIKFALDACLGVDGYPQSATGQSTIYTGINCAQLNGKHLFGFPNKLLKKVIKDNSILVKLKSFGYKCRFINAFRPVFFTSPQLFNDIRMSTTVEMNRAAGLSFNSLNDLKNKKALYHDYTNLEIIQKGFDIKKYTANEAANILIEQAKQNDFILYEYFLTDIAGHSQNIQFAIDEINKTELVISEIVDKLDFSKHSFIVCSDHGNIEDLSVKSHTKNPAFFAIWTKREINKLKSLLDIYPLILKMVTKKADSNEN